MSNRIKEIKRTKDWRRQLELAQKKYPGTPLDSLFKDVQIATQFAQEFPPNSCQAALAHQMFAEIGLTFSKWISGGDSQKFFDVGKMVCVWKRHAPRLTETDKIRATVIALRGMFPEGEHRRELVNGKIEKRERYGKIAVRDVVKNLKLRGIRVDDNTRRKIQRELGPDRDKRPGCPKGTRKKPARPETCLP